MARLLTVVFPRRFAPLCSLLLMLSIGACAQLTNVSNDQATPIPGAGHDYVGMLSEIVNPANGGVSVRIQAPIPKGRLLTHPFSFAYDSNSVRYLQAGPGGAPQWSQDFPNLTPYLTKGGWSYTVPMLSYAIGYKIVSGGGHTSQCGYVSSYMFQEPGGGQHALHLAIAQPTGPGICAPGDGGFSVLNSGDDLYRASTSGSWGANITTDIASADGTVYHFLGNYARVGLLPSFIEDRNGNKITSTDNGQGTFSFTDTIGRVVISASSFASSAGDTITISGLPSAYSVAWKTVSSNFSTGMQIEPRSFCSAITNDTQQKSVVSSITLPNGQRYTFLYGTDDSSNSNPYGLLSKIVYPSGGWVKYSYAQNTLSEYFFSQNTNTDPNTLCNTLYGRAAITKRTVSFDGTNVALQQTFSYSTTWNNPTYPTMWTAKQTTVSTHDFVTGQVTETDYAYSPISIGYPPNLGAGSGPQVALEQTITYKDVNSAVVRTVTKGWFDQYEPACQLQTLDTGSISGTFYKYGSGAQPTDRKEYDYGLITSASACPATWTGSTPQPSATPTREIAVSYASFVATPIFPSAPSIFDRPSAMITYGNGTRAAETDYTYDQTSVSGIGSLVSGTHDETNYGSSSTVPRGNATTITRVCFPNCTNTVTTSTFDETGQVLATTDPCGNGTCNDLPVGNHTTTYSYTDSYTVLSGGHNVPYTPTAGTNALLTQISDALGHSQTFSYDYSSSQLTLSKDANAQSTTYLYTNTMGNPETLGRLGQINYPDGGQTEFAYNDTAPSPSVTTCKLISGTAGAACSAASPASGWKTTLASLDGLGHVVQSQLVSDPDGVTSTATSYDGLGKAYQTYNPTRCQTPTTNCGTEATWGVATYTYDALGRTTNVNQPDGSVVTSLYTGNSTTVTDEVGNQRKSQTDGLGRLTRVWEAPANTGYNYETDYQYDVLGNLVCAVQKGNDTTQFTTCATAPATWRPRSFIYDSLSRLTSASNPESGTITYTYDLNGNLATKVAPKAGQTGTQQTTINYSYDVLNRLAKKSYANPSNNSVFYGYDGTPLMGCPGPSVPIISSPTNRVGRRSAMCANQSASSWSYDSMGRSLVEARTNRGSTAKTYNTKYSYFKNGSLNTLTYPSGGVVTYNVGGAERVTSAKDSSNNYVMPNFPCPGCATVQHEYAPFGGLGAIYVASTATSANIFFQQSYNSRMQMDFMEASATQTLLWRTYDYHPGSGDNGNLFGLTDNVDSTRSSAFSYDSLNRIKQANTTTTTGANCWGEVYTIDSWGNVYNRSGVSGMTGCSYESLNTSASTKNQLAILTYDAAGNVTNDGNGNMPTYDAENRIATDAGVTYSYDADGVRIEKSSGTMYWPGPSGALAETDLNGTINEEYIFFNGERIARVDRPSGSVHYYFADHLGSASVITDASGNVQERYFYYPYGGQQSSSGTDPNHYKFTGKERDTESGLDNFGKRYDASSLGRFMTTDPVVITTERLTNPQQLNLYAYVANNPLRFIDPTGEILQCVGTADQQKQCFADLQQIAGDTANRLSMDAKTGMVSFDTTGLDLGKNEGAALVNNLVGSKNTYDFSIGPTVMTDKGPVKIDYIEANLPSFGDQPKDGNPPSGVSDIVALYFNNPNVTRASNTNLKIAPEWTVAFHELAEAYEKIDGGKGGSYAAGHNAALQRELELRDQRPYLKEYNTGAGGPANSPNPEGKIIIKQ